MKPIAPIRQLLVVGDGASVKAVLVEYDETRHRARRRFKIVKNEKPEKASVPQVTSLFLEEGVCVLFDAVLAETLTTGGELPDSIHATVAKALDLTPA